MKWLIISDLDGTLLGDDAALSRFAAWYESQHDHVLLAYSSGRSFTSVTASIHATQLPDPVAVIGNVGTQICRYPGGLPVPGWPKVGSLGWSAERVRASLADMPGLQLQPEEFQSPHKVSYFLHNAGDVLQEVQRRLQHAQLAADIVYSSQRDLDVLPQGANKGSAARYLAHALRVPDERVIVCGDTGNDIAMFRVGFRGIIVGNALPELKALADGHAYLAHRHHAHGVLEGMLHWMT